MNRYDMDSMEYGGFFLRTCAYLIDYILLIIITTPILRLVYGTQIEQIPFENEMEALLYIQGPTDFLLRFIAPSVVIFIFWLQYDATPGKMFLGMKIVDADTGGRPQPRQYLIRILGQFVSFFFFFIGVIWVAFDPRKQSWHDKMARTVVIRKKSRNSP